MSALEISVQIGIALLSSIIGAVLAFRYQNTIELKRDKRLVVQNLMIYRNVGANDLDWIKTLNAIDLVFNDNLEVKRLYHLFLEQTEEPAYQNGEWVKTYNNMVFEMAKGIGYNNLTLDEINDVYSPTGLNQHYPNRHVIPSDQNAPAGDDSPST